MKSAKLLLSGSVAAAGLAYAVRGRSSSWLAPSVWRGSSRRKAVALTFDDGPSVSTPEILSELAKYGAAATFFQCGANVERLPEIARTVAAAGHEIGNHSYSHPLFCFRSPSFVENEFRRAQKAISAATGTTPALLRAPFGARWFGFRRAQRRLGLLGVMWTIIGYDWKLDSGAIVTRVGRSLRNGSIICLHDGRELRARPDIRETVLAVRRLLPLIRDNGYELQTVTQLICPMK